MQVVCKQQKRAPEYHDSIWHHRQEQLHHRCRVCFVCPTCPAGTQHVLVDFAWGEKHCKLCAKVACSACGQAVAKSKVASNQKATMHLCKSCQKLGCTFQDVQLYRCNGCLRGKGRLSYNAKMLNNFKTRGSFLCCTACQTNEKELQGKIQKTNRAQLTLTRFNNLFTLCGRENERELLIICQTMRYRNPEFLR